MELLRSRKSRSNHLGTESYTIRQLELLRMANYLIQNGNTRLLDTLDLLLSALMTSAESRHEAQRLVSVGSAPRSVAPRS